MNNKIKIIDTEIANGKSSITRTVIAKYYEYKIKVSVKSDTNKHKCTATLYAFDNNAMTWNAIHSIAPSKMTTRAGLSDQWDKSDAEIEYRTQKDMDKLLDMATKLLD